MHLVRLALGDHHERARHQRLARALVARHVEDRSPRIAAGTVRRAPLLKWVRGDAAMGRGYPASRAVPRARAPLE